MKTCDYCGVVDKKRTFCNSKHKTYYYRGHKIVSSEAQPVAIGVQSVPDKLQPIIEKDTPIEEPTGRQRDQFDTTSCNKHRGFKGTCGCK